MTATCSAHRSKPEAGAHVLARRYAPAVAAAAAGAVLALRYAEALAPNQFLPYLAAVLLSAARGGFGPGLAATLLSATGVLHALAWRPSAAELGLLALFLGCGALLSRLLARLHAEQQRARAGETERTFLCSMLDAVPYLVFARDHAGRFILVNRAFAALAGCRPAELVGRTAAECADRLGEAGRPIVALAAAGHEPGAPASEEVALDGPGATRRWFEVRRMPMCPDDGECQVLGIVTEITEQREAEATLRRREEQLRLAQRMEAVGRLAGGVAHDFNNMMMIVGGYAEQLLQEGRPEDRVGLEAIIDAASRASALTRQLLAFSRQQLLQPQVLQLNAVVEQSMPMLRRLISEDIHVRCELEPGLDAIRADPVQMQQILMNLATNARDAMPTGGELVFRTASSELTAADAERFPYVAPGRYLLLEVSDTGHGMDAQTLQHVFEPFFTKGVGIGTGLGLATVYGIVKQSGGYIWVASEPGQGSRFRIYLPPAGAAAGTEPEGGAGAEPPPARGKGTILLVEDEESLRRLLCGALQRSGYTVLEASNGADALARCSACAPSIDLVATDVVMPGMGGHELVQRLRAANPRLRAVYMSGYSPDMLAPHGLDSTVPLLQKPFTPARLAREVEALLR